MLPSKSPSDNHKPTAIWYPEKWTEVLPIERMFAAGRPLEVDIGCGKGRFIMATARANPGTNYLGIDRMLKRLRKVDRKVTKQGLTNVRLVRVEAAYAVEFLLPPSSVTAVYVFFPDPWPKRKHHKRRLFTQLFMDALDKVMTANAQIHVATDDAPYFDEIYELLRSDRRFSEIPALNLSEEQRTDFELLFTGMNIPIGRCSFAKK